MANDSKINALDSIDEGQASKSNITGTTVDKKRLLDVNVLGYGPYSPTPAPRAKEIFNVPIVSSDQEQSLVLPEFIVGYMIRTRGSGSLKLSHVSGESGSKYLTVPARATHVDSHSYSNLTIYFQSPAAGEIVEVVAWV